jgi:hypothetical protein
VTERNPRRRRAGSLRGEAGSEPLGLDASSSAAEGAAAEGVAPEPVEPAQDADRAFEDTNIDAGAAAAGAGSLALIDPHGDATDVIQDVPEMSVEDVERRIGARSRERRRRVAMAVPATQRVAANRRVVLWRDSATILIFVVVALLAARFLLPSDAGTANATESATETPVVIGSVPVATGIQFSAAPTINGGVVPSGLHVDATPTPIPVITEAPTPVPTPTAKPTPTLKPGQTPVPTTGPKPSHTPTPTAPPTVSFSWNCTDASTHTVHFIASATAGTNATITSYKWSFSDGTVQSTPGPTIDYAYSTSGPFPGVIVTVYNSTGGHANSLPKTVTC